MADSKSVAENNKKGLEYIVSQIPRKLSKTVRIISKRLPVHLKISLGKISNWDSWSFNHDNNNLDGLKQIKYV